MFGITLREAYYETVVLSWHTNAHRLVCNTGGALVQVVKVKPSLKDMVLVPEAPLNGNHDNGSKPAAAEAMEGDAGATPEEEEVETTGNDGDTPTAKQTAEFQERVSVYPIVLVIVFGGGFAECVSRSSGVFLSDNVIICAESESNHHQRKYILVD